MKTNTVQKSGRSGFWYSLVLVFLFFVIASFYANKNEVVTQCNYESRAEAGTTEGLHQFIPGLWQIAY